MEPIRTPFTPLLQQPNYDLDAMLIKAQEFAKNDDKLLACITTILKNDKFRSSPKWYLDAWKVKSGYAVLYKTSEDKAREFFDAFFFQ